MPRKQIFIAAGVAAVIALAGAGYYLTRDSDSGSAPSTASEPASSAAPVQGSGKTPETHMLVLDQAALMRASMAGQDISRQVQAYANQAKGELQARGNALQRDGAALKQQAAAMAPDVREKRVADFESRQAAFQADAQAKDAQLKGGVAKARGQMMQVLAPILKQIMAARGGNILLDKQAVPFATDTTFDITQDVITQLNAKLPSVKVDMNAPPAAAPAQ